ncbi:hypothetical protein Goari_025398 [Gossypium aridum]|uniref:dihydroneopterin aldolase n=1 Tax=Gossypium aridum TaxID=34290 RepID=A0A7J8X921_GOSAI|nr:hypothetical protein [Gossypium aridum]
MFFSGVFHINAAKVSDGVNSGIFCALVKALQILIAALFSAAKSLFWCSAMSSVKLCRTVESRYWKWNTIGDNLILRSLKFHGFHGVKLEEKKMGQKFLVDVDAWMDLWKVDKFDNLSDTGIYR